MFSDLISGGNAVQENKDHSQSGHIVPETLYEQIFQKIRSFRNSAKI